MYARYSADAHVRDAYPDEYFSWLHVRTVFAAVYPTMHGGGYSVDKHGFLNIFMYVHVW